MIANASRTARGPCRTSTPANNHGIGRQGRAGHDRRWPALAETLGHLREAGRHSIRIVDADCGAGCLLIHAARYARTLGFMAIEGRGIDGAPQLVGRARAAAARLGDAAIGLGFEAADLLTALEEEAEFPADIVLWHGEPGGLDETRVLAALHRAAGRVITDRSLGMKAGA